MRAELAEARAQIVELKRQLGQNSKNSSRPPSGDQLQRCPSRAERRKPGKQSGARGFTRRRAGDPDDRRDHVPPECGGCGGNLAAAQTVKVIARQVCDLPEITSVRIVEHCPHSRRCRCGHVTDAPAWREWPPRSLTGHGCGRWRPISLYISMFRLRGRRN
ncbi:DUF6444 domain-containing protein [Nocardia sp. NPDC051570]|uniref:DUF6444 domain-containing protein n=1 Tax=Nocardia sp. NPDC051570 TaxID=3364324 RepID=UPI00378DF68E